MAGVRLGKVGNLIAMAMFMMLCGSVLFLGITQEKHPAAPNQRGSSDQGRGRLSLSDRMHDIGGGGTAPRSSSNNPDAVGGTALQASDSAQHQNHPQPLGRPVLCKPPFQVGGSVTGGPVRPHFRPKLLFIAGIEGSGHHGLVPMFRELEGVTLIASAEQILTNLWDPTVSIAEQRKLRGMLLRAIQNKFNQCISTSQTPVEQHCSHFMLFGRANFFRYVRALAQV